jgi:hypothetical protein
MPTPHDPRSPFAQPFGQPQWPATSPHLPSPPPKRGRWWIVGVIVGGVLLLSCGGCMALVGVLTWANRDVDPNDLAGDWKCMNTRYTIVVEGGTPRVSSVVDEGDGERMVVESCTWNEATLSWVLLVPSSGTRVQESLYATRSGLALGMLNGTYSSTHAPGGGVVGAAVFTRQR